MPGVFQLLDTLRNKLDCTLWRLRQQLRPSLRTSEIRLRRTVRTDFLLRVPAALGLVISVPEAQSRRSSDVVDPLCEVSIDVWQTLRPLLSSKRRQLNDCLLMQCTERPRDTERGDGSTSATAERTSSLRLPRLQHAVRALRPNRETDPERSPDWRSITRAPVQAPPGRS